MFQEGDKVEYIDSKASFTVLKVLGSESLLVLDEFEMEYTIRQIDVLKVDEAGLQFLQKPLPLIKKEASNGYSDQKMMKSRYINTFKISGKRKAQVDLHLHEIMPDDMHFEPTKALEYQMKVFEQSFERALSARVGEFLIIHGYGKGVLRSEIRKFLSNKGLEFMDADYGEYGQGATRCFMR